MEEKQMFPAAAAAPAIYVIINDWCDLPDPRNNFIVAVHESDRETIPVDAVSYVVQKDVNSWNEIPAEIKAEILSDARYFLAHGELVGASTSTNDENLEAYDGLTHKVTAEDKLVFAKHSNYVYLTDAINNGELKQSIHVRFAPKDYQDQMSALFDFAKGDLYLVIGPELLWIFITRSWKRLQPAEIAYSAESYGLSLTELLFAVGSVMKVNRVMHETEPLTRQQQLANKVLDEINKETAGTIKQRQTAKTNLMTLLAQKRRKL